MRWFKKIVRAILNLLPIFFVVFFTMPVSALKHQYLSVPLYSPPRPEIQYNSSSGKYELTGRAIGSGNYSNFEIFGVDAFSVLYTPDNISQSLKDSDVFSSSSSNRLKYFNSFTSSEKCVYNSIYGGSFKPIFSLNQFNLSSGSYWQINSSSSFKRIPENSYITDFGYQSGSTSFDFRCMRLHSFGSGGVPEFDVGSMPADFAGQYSNNLSPYSYGADGFFSVSTTVKDGMHYSENFNFAKIFGEGNYLNKFSSLNFSLFDEQQSIDYYSGRDIEYAGSFTFESSFTISQTAVDSGHFYVAFFGIATDGRTYSHNISCTLNQRSVEAINYYGLEYSCPWTVDHDYLFTYQTFHIDAIPDGSENNPSLWGYVWDTDGRWIWSGQTGAGQYIITDNDDTPGDPINSNRSGNYIPNDAARIANLTSDDIIIDGQNFSASLINLFGFNFINPFAPIFNLFNSGSNCVQIPTIAGMIHSEESQVCPWFDSSVRNIVTPVLGISSMMLVFGFAVRWLGSSSGNLFEDSSNETLAPPGYSGHWGRRKK